MFNKTAAIMFVVTLPSIAQSQNMQTSPEVTSLLQTRSVPKGLTPTRYTLSAVMSINGVPEELAISERQAAEWKEINDGYLRKRTDSDKKYKPLVDDIIKRIHAAPNEGEERAILEQKLSDIEQQRRQETADLTEKLDGQLMKLLSRKQEVRLKEIRMQAEGPVAFERQTIQEQMGLLPDQVVAIQRINNEIKQKFRQSSKLPKVSEPSIPDTITKAEGTKDPLKKSSKLIDSTIDNMVNARNDATKSIEKVLNGTQRKVYRNMLGEPFEFLKQHKEKIKSEPTVGQ